jgi:hypothetical protein
MDDLVVDVNRGAVGFQGQFDNVYRADNARTKAARPYSQQDFSVLLCSSLHQYPKM